MSNPISSRSPAPIAAPPRAAAPVVPATTTATATARSIPAGADVFTSAAGAPGGADVRDGFPWVSQRFPAGATADFRMGDVFCAPAIFVMVARKLGLGGGQTDAALMQRFAELGGTEPGTGTSLIGVSRMAAAVGLPVQQSEASFRGFDRGWLDRQLTQGKSVIANGALETEGGPSNHYLLITGRNADGSYRVSDPWDATRRSMTAADLGAFYERNTVHDGAALALG